MNEHYERRGDVTSYMLAIAAMLLAVAQITANMVNASLREDHERVAAEVAVAKGELAALSGRKAERLEAGDLDAGRLGEGDALDAEGNAADVGNDKPRDGFAERSELVSNGCARLRDESRLGAAVASNRVDKCGDGNDKGSRSNRVGSDFGRR